MPTPRGVGLAAELCVKKSSPIFYNCLDLVIGKGRVGRTVNKSLIDAHWLWLPKLLTIGEPSRQDEVRFPCQIQDLSEQSTCGRRETLASPTFSPEEEGKHGPAHRSLLWRLTACQAGPYFTHVSRLTLCETDKVVIPARRGS